MVVVRIATGFDGFPCPRLRAAVLNSAVARDATPPAPTIAATNVGRRPTPMPDVRGAALAEKSVEHSQTDLKIQTQSTASRRPPHRRPDQRSGLFVAAMAWRFRVEDAVLDRTATTAA